MAGRFLNFNVHYEGEIYNTRLPNKGANTVRLLLDRMHNLTGQPRQSIWFAELPGHPRFSRANIRFLPPNATVDVVMTIQHPSINIRVVFKDNEDNMSYEVDMFQDLPVWLLKSRLSVRFPNCFPQNLDHINLSYNGVALADDTATLESYGITTDSVLQVE